MPYRVTIDEAGVVHALTFPEEAVARRAAEAWVRQLRRQGWTGGAGGPTRWVLTGPDGAELCRIAVTPEEP